MAAFACVLFVACLAYGIMAVGFYHDYVNGSFFMGYPAGSSISSAMMLRTWNRIQRRHNGTLWIETGFVWTPRATQLRGVLLVREDQPAIRS